MNVLEIRNLSKSYGGTNLALDNCNLVLKSGSIVGLLGPNGSGKTTLIKIINGLLSKTSGEVLVCGEPISPITKAMVAYLPDRNSLKGMGKISDALEYFQDFYADFRMEIAIDMLQRLNIPHNKRLKELSKGTLEKVNLILIMSRNARLYLLDEPIAGVDPASRDYIMRTIISNYNPEGTILISTHLIGDIEGILDEVVFLKQGQMVLFNSAEAIRERENKSVDAYFREVFAC